jgi:hypothetical protein
MSYVSTTWTPLPSGTAIALNEVTDIDWDLGGEPEAWYANGSRFPRLVLVPKYSRNVTVSGGDVNKLLTVPLDTDGTFTTTLRDAKNGIGTGALTFTLTPCKVVQQPNQGSTGKFATGKISLMAYASDGQTDPLTFAVAV